MEILSINVGARRRLQKSGFDRETGICKEPVPGAQVGAQGLEGDVIVDTKHHGGPDQAVYLYRREDYDWWSAELGRRLEPGTFGENLTVAGLPEPGLAIGSRLRFETVVLEVTAPRIPCSTLAARMNDVGFVKRFLQAARPGIYFRVLTPGRLEVGERFTVEPHPGLQVTTVEMFRDWHRRLDRAEIERYLAVPIDHRSRRYLEQKLEEQSAAEG